jgi:spore coat protein U-like protein
MIARYKAAFLVLLACGGGFAAAQRCSFSATNIGFGNYSGSTIRATGTLTVSCPLGILYAISLDAGTGPGATVSNRSMTAGSDRLQYGLFSNASDTANWGNTPGTGWVVGIGNGRDQFLTVYGMVPGHQLPVPGRGRLYNDNIVATLSSRDVQSQTARIRVTANVLDACSVSATDLAFGTYSGSLVNAVSSISISCTNSTRYNVGLNAGTAVGATVTNRSMTGPGSALLHYNLFSDPVRSVNWGNTVGVDTEAGMGTGGVETLIVYGQVGETQTALQPGSYSDTITVTVTY